MSSTLENHDAWHILFQHLDKNVAKRDGMGYFKSKVSVALASRNIQKSLQGVLESSKEIQKALDGIKAFIAKLTKKYELLIGVTVLVDAENAILFFMDDDDKEFRKALSLLVVAIYEHRDITIGIELGNTTDAETHEYMAETIFEMTNCYPSFQVVFDPSKKRYIPRFSQRVATCSETTINVTKWAKRFTVLCNRIEHQVAIHQKMQKKNTKII
jgi:hypothetical protein